MDEVRGAAQNLEKMQIDISELQQTSKILFDTVTALGNMHETLKKEMHLKKNPKIDPLPPIPDVISQTQENPVDHPTEMRQEETKQKIRTESRILPVVTENNTKSIR
jgi:hypothetical protein